MQTATNSVAHLSEIVGDFEIVDLSPLLEPHIPKWPTHPHLVIDQTVTHESDGYYCQTISMAEHSGAHVDSPAHIHSDRMASTIETFGLDKLMGEAVIYRLCDLGLKAGELATAKDILALESKSGEVAGRGNIALLNFGWQKYWKTGNGGKFYVYNAPGLDESAAKLLTERGIKAIGSDTIACDQAMKDGVAIKSFIHDVYGLPHDILIMEELMNLNLLPSRVYFMAFPLKIWRGSGSPIRAVALVPRKAG
jgi:kynurenine formamidase